MNRVQKIRHFLNLINYHKCLFGVFVKGLFE